MTIEKRFHDGAWVIYSTINGYLVTRVYVGYSKREAMRIYREEVK